MLRDQINFSYLSRISPKKLEKILFTGRFTQLHEFDQCTQTWHLSGSQGPFFIIKSDQIYLILLNQNSTYDFIRVLKKGMKHSFQISGQWCYFQFQDEGEKSYNIWFSDKEEFRTFQGVVQDILDSKQ
ncbi:mRNA-decapping enzyme 1A [Paramecium bursaria]